LLKENPYFSELPTRELNAAFKKMERRMPGFIAAALVNLHTGTVLATHSAKESFDLEAACAFNSEIIRQEHRALQAIGSKSTLVDILLALSDQVHILKMVDSGAAFLYLVVDRTLTSLATARYELNQHATEISLLAPR